MHDTLEFADTQLKPFVVIYKQAMRYRYFYRSPGTNSIFRQIHATHIICVGFRQNVFCKHNVLSFYFWQNSLYSVLYFCPIVNLTQNCHE